MKGVVHRAGGGVYVVRLEDGRTVEASLRGRLKRERRTGDKVVVGDRVVVEPVDDAWTVEAVEPRDTELVRRGKGGRRPKVVAANLDRMVAVVAAREPDARPDLVDRLLVVAEANDLPAVLVVNKVDLPGGEGRARDIRALYEGIGYDVLTASAVRGDGLGELEAVLARGSSVLVGPSGAGKSTLLNALDPGLDLRTGALSRKTGSGRHTTVNARLIPLSCGGLVADTPGFGDVGVWGLEPREVERCFPELAEHLGACRFRGCAHMAEPDCAVKDAVEADEIAESRYRSYLTLRGEAEE